MWRRVIGWVSSRRSRRRPCRRRRAYVVIAVECDVVGDVARAHHPGHPACLQQLLVSSTRDGLGNDLHALPVKIGRPFNTPVEAELSAGNVCVGVAETGGAHCTPYPVMQHFKSSFARVAAINEAREMSKRGVPHCRLRSDGADSARGASGRRHGGRRT